jgi:hypothetical protein
MGNFIQVIEASTITMDCPICMEPVNGNTNKVVTDCGHTFHCSCLMQNTAHNGFKCPYCRTVMAVEPEDEPEDQYEDEDDTTSVETFVMFDEYALTSFRMFHQRINNEDIEEEEEEDVNDWETVSDMEDTVQMPDSGYVAEKLLTRGIRFEDLVMDSLFCNHAFLFENYNDYERRSHELFGHVRAIISQYKREQSRPQPEPQPHITRPDVAESKPHIESYSEYM